MSQDSLQESACSLKYNILPENLKAHIPLVALSSVTYFIIHFILKMFPGSKVKWLKATLFPTWLKAVAFKSL